MKGKIETVLGPIEPDKLGLTLTHEHLLHDLPKEVFRKPLPPALLHLTERDYAMHNLGWIRQYPYCFDENNEFNDEAVRKAVKEEMIFFKQCGGGTIVENGSIGLRSKDQAKFLKAVSEVSGVNIVAGTGFYVTQSQATSTLNMTQEHMEELIRTDLLKGMDGTDVKCGVIGEIGCSWPLSDFEKRSLMSSATVQRETGCPVIIHPGRNKHAPEEIVRIFQEAGGKSSQTVMSHLERTLFTTEDLADFASLGTYCEFDLFGLEVSHYQHNEDVDMPSDAQRIALLKCLVQQGYDDKIVISHDIHTKHRLIKFGGHGYSHIILNVVPKMLNRGFSDVDIKKFLFVNPRTWLTFQ